MRLVVVSDTHLRHTEIRVPFGDVLIHCGDSTMNGAPRELARVGVWLAAQPHRGKLIIAGNHELTLQRSSEYARIHWPSATYLFDRSVEIEGICFYGSPWQPEFNNWAFNLPRGEALAAKWRRVPSDTQVLITHGPPHGILDTIGSATEHLGCEELRKRVDDLGVPLHVFGHIHGGYGVTTNGATMFVNASVCDETYQPANQPWVLDLTLSRGRIAKIDIVHSI